MPPLGRLLRTALILGAVPLIVQMVLLLTEEVSTRSAILAMLAVSVMALGLAWFWLVNLARLSQALRAAAADDDAFSLPFRTPRLPAVADIEDGLTRLARSLQARSALVGQLRAADEAIVENLPDPLLVLAEDRSALRANRAARQLFGLKSGAAGDLAALLRHPALAGAVERALAEQTAQGTDLHLPVPVARELHAQAIPMNPPLADGGRVVVVLSDRTQMRAVERMRADFVANASHELRTPLASLIGFIETLRGPAQDDEEARERFLGIMATQSERMRMLIDDLLSLSRIELSEHQPPQGEADIAALLRAEAVALEPLAKGTRIEIQAPPVLLASPADAEQLAQVLRNLLENALRHGKREGLVRASLTRVTGGPRLPNRPGILLAVADDGPGIPREHIPRLTERFYRVEQGRGRGTGGTGLGLAIVKHIVNRHRGQLIIESDPGNGATFKVWLPGD
jgi:two-component system, OmpR family, phosphate regulon sensor histidine kinase PhoR